MLNLTNSMKCTCTCAFIEKSKTFTVLNKNIYNSALKKKLYIKKLTINKFPIITKYELLFVKKYLLPCQ